MKASHFKSIALTVLGLALAGAEGMAQAQATTSVTRTVTMEYDAYGQVIRETVEPDDPALRVVTDYGRDTSYGVLTSRTRSWRDPATGADQSRVIETLGYDARKRFATTITNAKNQGETRSHDEGSGALLTLTGPNQLSTTWQYDGWGRKTRQTEADGTASSWAYRQCVDSCQTSAGGTAVSVVVTQSWAGSAQAQIQTQVPTEAFSDTLGRDIQTRSWSFDGRAVLTERAYDSLGRLAQTAPARFTGSAAVWTYQDHDDLGRVTRVRQPNAAGSGYDESLTTYNGLAVTRANPKNQSRTEVSNGLGKLKSVTDAAGKTTSYLYDPWGNLTRTSDPAGNQIKISYDRLGRKTQLADPDLGSWTYSMDPLGQTWRQVDAKGQTTRYDFDELGRMTHRLEADLESYWVYDTASRGIGKLAEAYTWVNGAKDYQRLHSYDAYGRAAATTIRLDWDYVEETGYDGFGRQSSTTYRRNTRGGSGGPSQTLSTVYNAQGYAAQLTRGSTTLWTAQAQDAQGRVTQAQLGNGLIRRRGYNAYTGRLESIAAGPDAGSASHEDDRYTYDAVGNLLSRSQLAATSGALMSENFGYDSLNRLASSQVSGQAAKSYGYDALGNLTSQGSLTYSYPPSGAGSVRPHAAGGITGSVAGLSNPGFSYDANGNLAEGLGRRYGWTSFNQAGTIDKLSGSTATQRTAFLFDPEHQRTRQTVSPMSAGVPGAATRTVYYGPGIEKEIDSSAGTTTIRTYLPGGLGYLEERLSGTAVDATASATAAERYFLNDRLGSPIAIVDAARTVLQRLSHDPWGRRRNTDGSDDASATLGSITNGQDHTGYTGHEQLDQLALVHMNGRIYDPITARMLSADPTVPDPSDTQSLNRYSYVLNNPFAYVDPSGYEGKPAGEQPHAEDVMTMRRGGCSIGMGGCSIIQVNPSSGSSHVTNGTFNGIQVSADAANNLGGGQVAAANGSALPPAGAANAPGGPLLQPSWTDVGVGLAIGAGGVGLVAGGIELGAGVWGVGSAVASYGLRGAVYNYPLQATALGIGLGETALAVGTGAVTPGTFSGLRLRGECFTAGTQVQTATGLTPIEDIRVGDFVAARDEVSGQTSWRPVVRLFRHEDKEVVRVTYADEGGAQETLGVTLEHPFRVVGRGWVGAGALREGDRIERLRGGSLVVVHVYADSRRQDTYNFEVADVHTYFVGNGGAWVHNASVIGDALASRGVSAYSVAFETVIPKVGAGTRGAHFAAANRSLAEAMKADPELATMMNGLGIRIPQRLDQGPANWTWHHVPDQLGTLQLTPRPQHQGGPWQPLFHPNQTGGFKLWGADY